MKETPKQRKKRIKRKGKQQYLSVPQVRMFLDLKRNQSKRDETNEILNSLVAKDTPPS